ncbi:hypothetical protein ADUPG1_007131 [Aduncisulcus paluster]|uniref:Uncharacterized protein n=1 Tax=Aduncisulcus paluster TaxID=2918883 RepID=A0ABQ5KKV0_9EUKA|nr:hypothetical protein ADUPG1_007131 [Aduncisulcus paluster]
MTKDIEDKFDNLEKMVLETLQRKKSEVMMLISEMKAKKSSPSVELNSLSIFLALEGISHQPYLLIPFALTTIGAIGEKAWDFIEHVRRNGTDFMVPGRTREERSRRWVSTLLCGLGRGLCIREATCVSSYSWNLIQKKEPKSKGSHLSF